MRLLPLLFIVLSFFAQAQKKPVFNASDLKLDWKLITNNFQGKDQYQFSITLTNNNKKTIKRVFYHRATGPSIITPTVMLQIVT
ncbi:MAG: hypothetical protein RLZZ390_1130 [Bacteroidota bacterium]